MLTTHSRLVSTLFISSDLSSLHPPHRQSESSSPRWRTNVSMGRTGRRLRGPGKVGGPDEQGSPDRPCSRFLCFSEFKHVAAPAHRSHAYHRPAFRASFPQGPLWMRRMSVRGTPNTRATCPTALSTVSENCQPCHYLFHNQVYCFPGSFDPELIFHFIMTDIH